jgi:hypothetical protein
MARLGAARRGTAGQGLARHGEARHGRYGNPNNRRSKMKLTNQDIQTELERIRKKNAGVINPKDVVEEASDPKNILHQKFEWDDTKAAYGYRLSQARKLIRVVVEKIEPDCPPVRVYVSLEPDRTHEIGYRATRDVLSSDTLSALLLEQSKRDMQSFTSKYRQIKELSEIISAMDKFID